jgi:Acyltransferase family
MLPDPPADATTSWKRLDGVDMLRGLAILFVLMNHVNMQLLFAQVPYTRGLPRQLVSSLVWNGQFGVQMFFAVSGFLITSTTIRRWGALRDVRPRDFYLLRFARIAPLLFLLLTILSVLHLAQVRHFVVSQEVGGLKAALVAALTFRINLLEARRGYLPGSWDILWSLSVEETFYLFFPLTCKALGRGKLLIAFLVAFVLLGPFGRTILTHGNAVWQEYSYLGGDGCNRLRLPYRHLHRSSATPKNVTSRASCCGSSACDLHSLLLAHGPCMGIGAIRIGYDDPRCWNVHADRCCRAKPMEGSPLLLSAAVAGPAQLRGLSDAHVRRNLSLRFIRAFR